jgi:hypothetical protein
MMRATGEAPQRGTHRLAIMRRDGKRGWPLPYETGGPGAAGEELDCPWSCAHENGDLAFGSFLTLAEATARIAPMRELTNEMLRGDTERSASGDRAAPLFGRSSARPSFTAVNARAVGGAVI